MRALGAAMILLFSAGLFAWMVRHLGLKTAVTVLSAAAAMALWIFAGVHLATTGRLW